jgi:hypothetical protein
MREGDVRCNKYLQKRRRRGRAAESAGLLHGEEQTRELAKLMGGEMAQLISVQIAHRLIQPCQQSEPGRCNADKDFAAIGIFAATADEASFLEAVEETGDVRITGDHAARDLTAKKPLRRAAEDAQNVVLIRREIVFFQELGRAARQTVGGAHEFDEDGFLWAGNGTAESTGSRNHIY